MSEKLKLKYTYEVVIEVDRKSYEDHGDEDKVLTDKDILEIESNEDTVRNNIIFACDNGAGKYNVEIVK